jgi:sigma-B regulation protein RsbU (phosphoserine phosphatase)
MSMLNISFLNEIIIERGIRLPNEVLNTQRNEIIKALNPSGAVEKARDGMDCVLCAYDFDKMLLHFAAANNPLWLIRNGELAEYKADKMPVGMYHEELKPFALNTIELQKGDIVYTSSDGYGDQFGENGKKLMKKRFKEELLKIAPLPMEEQKDYLNNFVESWKGKVEQVDDILVIGIRI